MQCCVCALACVCPHLKQRWGGYGLDFPPEGCLPLRWGHGRWVEGSMRVVWIPPPGAASLGLYGERALQDKKEIKKNKQLKVNR